MAWALRASRLRPKKALERAFGSNIVAPTGAQKTRAAKLTSTRKTEESASCGERHQHRYPTIRGLHVVSKVRAFKLRVLLCPRRPQQSGRRWRQLLGPQHPQQTSLQQNPLNCQQINPLISRQTYQLQVQLRCLQPNPQILQPFNPLLSRQMFQRSLRQQYLRQAQPCFQQPNPPRPQRVYRRTSRPTSQQHRQQTSQAILQQASQQKSRRRRQRSQNQPLGQRHHTS